jgi:hypothetical protein
VLEAVIAAGRSVRRAAHDSGVSRRSVGRWVRGLTGPHITTKCLCFFDRATIPPEHFGRVLLELFQRRGDGEPARGAAEGMMRLAEEFSCPLY